MSTNKFIMRKFKMKNAVFLYIEIILIMGIVWNGTVSQELGELSEFSSGYLISSRNDIEPLYIIVAPKVIHPATLYGVTITINDNSRIDHPFLSIRIEISKDTTEIVSTTESAPVGSTKTVFMQVPSSCTPGNYMLRVEGNYPHSSGGTVFLNQTEITFSPRFLSIVIQTSRPIYKAGQVVRFRVVLLTTDLKPFEDSVNVYVLNSDGFIMRRWVSIQINSGVISHKFTLPQLVNDGLWKIRVEAQDQIEDQKIRVEKYFRPLFEVHVSLPAYTLDTEKYISANISTHSDVERIARGNATFKMFGKYLKENDTERLIWDEKTSMANGKHYLLIPMEFVESRMGSLQGVELRVEAALSEYLYGETAIGFSHTRIISGTINLYFLGPSPMVFKPGTLFEGHVIVAYQDRERLSRTKLADSILRIEITAQVERGSSFNLPEIVALPEDKHRLSPEYEFHYWNDSRAYTTEYADVLSVERYRSEGVLYFKFHVPPKVSELILRAYYQDVEGITAETKIKAVRYYSPLKRYISVRTSTRDAAAGEFAVFHVKTNFRLESFQYMVLSKGLLLYADQQKVEGSNPTVTTFALPIDPNMAPGFRLLVYYVVLHGELVADSVFVPVNGFNGYEISLVVNQGKDHTKKTAEAVMTAKAGAFMGINSVRTSSYLMQAGNEMSKSRVIESFFAFENFTRSEPKIKWRSRQGLLPDEVVYFPSMNHGKDSNETFKASGVVVFTDAFIPTKDLSNPCEGKQNYTPCFTEGCFPENKRCDGYNDCGDWSDESNCTTEDDQYEYRVMRISRSDELYDSAGNDWSWKEMNADFGGEEYFTMEMPAVSDTWFFMGFCLSRSRGFTIVDTPLAFSSTRPFMMHVEGPTACRRGEQVGLRLLLLNNEPYEMFVVLTLHASPYYKFVHVEEGGIVTSFGARLSGGDHQHLVYLAAGTQQHVDIPIAPTIEQGDVEVIISAMTQVGSIERVHKITVFGEGALVNKHTSLYLDLKNRALVLQYLDIYVEETPIIPYQNWRRYVYGSTSGWVTLTGDVIGPAFPDIPLTAGVVLGREIKGTEGRVFEIAVNMWTLHYFRLTNQLKWDVAKQVLEEVNAIFAQAMKRFDKRGWFKNWDTSQPSVWLTAWAIRIFKQASFQDWENYFYIEPRIFTKCTEWLLKHQTEMGSFVETPWYFNPLDTKMLGKSPTRINDSVQYRNISLTAHVLITIYEVLPNVEGSVRTDAAKASIKAIRYLERQLASMTDPYEISITTYALTLCESIEKEFAFNLLHAKHLEVSDGLIYWSRVPVPPNVIRYENQRPFICPRDYQTDDSLAVEATSYALMVYLMRDGVTIIPEKIVQWLTSVRMASSSFISSTDSAIALQALTEYAFRARLKDITNMDVTLELPSTAGFIRTLHVDNTSYSTIQMFDVPNVWGHLNAIARGRGEAVLQMDINFGIDYEGFRELAIIETFDLEVKEFYSTFRNKSHITIQSCFRWLLEDPPVSGASVLEFEIPTGYSLLESEAEKLVESGIHPTLRDARIVEGKTFWFFDYISQEKTCFNHTIKRWYPVANISLHRQVQLYETFAKENFIQILVNSTPLYILNICEVCGSYQCPYCPYYSSTCAFTSSMYIMLMSITIFLLAWRYIHLT